MLIVASLHLNVAARRWIVRVALAGLSWRSPADTSGYRRGIDTTNTYICVGLTRSSPRMAALPANTLTPGEIHVIRCDQFCST
jgi:hypothetical protein